MKLPKYSMGVGDRFAHQGVAQLDAMIMARDKGVSIAPVWNKSYREHSIVGTKPESVRTEADAAVKARKWKDPYFVDADHIRLKTVDEFLESSDFFTLDVADDIGADPGSDAIAQFMAKHKKLVGRLDIAGIDKALEITEALVAGAARKFLAAVREAGRIWQRIEAVKGADAVVIEVSMDETDKPQTPAELLVILAAVADEAIPAQTIAPRFTGEFLKGVDYVGQVKQFCKEFDEDLAVIAYAIRQFGLPDNLKLSVHSGSDKFSIYRPMHQSLKKFNAGVHLKTAGTTWLEELIGLAAAGGDGLVIAKEIYAQALSRIDELCAPYASVVKIDRSALPSPKTVDAWDATTFASALRHDQSCKMYNSNLRQLLHVGYKLAAEMGARYTAALEKHEPVVAANVTENIYKRHICPLFLGE
ncbi:MAG: tagaturonate epimerase family protein [Thermoguttaceae bacterium]